MKSIHTPAYRALVTVLVDARRHAGLTQDQLARRLGRPQSFVAKFENRERRLDVIEFLLLSKALEFDPYEALRQIEEQLK